MDIDEIFKRPPLPKGSTKRKYEPPSILDLQSPVTKSAKLDAPSSGKGAKIVDANENGDDSEDEGHAEDFAPGGDADYFEEEDADGRFFGGGLSSVQKEVLNIMDHGAATGAEELGTAAGIKKQLLVLEKSINKNRDLRTKFASEPEKFVDSEFVLIETINSLLLLSSTPPLAYPLLIALSTPTSFADLLSHENSDVVIAVVEVLEEWTDEEVMEVDEEEENAEEEREQRRDAMTQLVKAITEAGVVDLVVATMARLDETDEGERSGVFHALGLVENLLLLLPALATPLYATSSPFLSFLVNRLGMDKSPSELDQNRWYAAEILSIILGLEVEGVIEGRERLAKEQNVDVLLRVISVYRKRDPPTSDTLEFLSNVFSSLCSALSSPLVKAAFLEGEGVELMYLMLKEKKAARPMAIRALDYAMQGAAGTAICERFIEMQGLGTLFSAFMGKSAAKKKLGNATLTHETTEHILSIISSLLTSLVSDSPPRVRLLAKFVENDYEKADRLLEIREDVEQRVAGANLGEEGDMDEDERYIARLGEGLFSLQLCDFIAAWLCMEDDGVRDHIMMLFSRKSQSLDSVIRVLYEYRDNVGEGTEEGDEQRAILANLLQYLESL